MISVIIPVYNAVEDVKICLNSLIKNFDFNNGEIIIINDCSNEQTTEFLNEFVTKNQDFIINHNEENLGFVKTCNKGMKMAKGDIIVLLNSDTKIPSNFCQKINACFASNEKIGVASPIASHSWMYYIHMPLLYSLEKMNKKLQKKHKSTYPIIPSAEGFCFCIRKEVIDKQGYLDEVYGKGYHEEVDFSYRAIQNGWDNVLIDNLYVYHKRNASFSKMRSKLVKQNNVVFKERWGTFREEFEEKINFINPVIQIRKELFPIKTFLRSYVYSKTKYANKRTVTIMGKKFHYEKRKVDV